MAPRIAMSTGCLHLALPVAISDRREGTTVGTAGGMSVADCPADATGLGLGSGSGPGRRVPVADGSAAGSTLDGIALHAWMRTSIAADGKFGGRGELLHGEA